MGASQIADLTPEQLAQLQARLKALKSAQSPAAGIPRRADAGPAPLSFAQQRIWFQEQARPGGAAFNLALAVRLRGALDVPALERTLDEIVRRHEVLRTTFALDEDGPVQVVHEDRGAALRREAMPAGASEDDVLRRARAEVAVPFDLARDTRLRALLLQSGPAEHVLVLVIHHVAADKWSFSVLLGELAALYAAFAAGAAPSLPDLSLQYADFAAWQRRRLAGSALDESLAFWTRHLEGAPTTLAFPADFAPAEDRFELERHPLRIPPALAAAVRETARAEGATPYAVLLAAYAVLLARWCGQDELLIGSLIANRHHAGTERLLGTFANLLVLRAAVADGTTFRGLVGTLRETLREAQRHQDLPFERLVEAVAPARGSRTPLVQTALNLSVAPKGTAAVAGLEMEVLPVVGGTAGFDFYLVLEEDGDGFGGVVEYNAARFAPATIARVAAAFERLLAGGTARPDARLDALALLGDADRRRIAAFHRPASEYPRDLPLHALFEAQAERTPDGIALAFRDQSLTYAELDARAHRLAERLRRMGVGPERRVGLLLERSAEMVVAALAVLKAGGAYVPLDASFPAPRLAWIAEDADLAAVVAHASLQSLSPLAGDGLLVLDGAGEGAANGPDVRPSIAVDPSSSAYLLYTSGSTGQPKGVAVQHRSVVNFLASMRDTLRPDPDGRLLSVTRLGFDISVLEIFLPLMVGGCVEIADAETAADGRLLAERIARGGIGAMQATPATWQMLVEAGWRGAPGFTALCGGEALPAPLARRLTDGGATLWNLYGPTETTIWSAALRVEEVDADGAVPLGAPIANTSLYVLDRGLRPVLPGASGELCIGGEGLARGYRNRPALTAEKFVPDPFSPVPGARMYRTGDLARITECVSAEVRECGSGGECVSAEVRECGSGSESHDESRTEARGHEPTHALTHSRTNALQFLGRADHQVKVRGFRVEPGEIEAALLRHPSIARAAVVARGEDGSRTLAAYVVRSASTESLDVDDVLRTAAGLLPPYMVPAVVEELDALPLNANGKTDRRALLERALAAPAAAEYVAPRTPLEALAADTWAAVLGVERVGIHDGFFARGGHSLLATRVVIRLQAALGVDVPLRVVFETDTLADFASRVEALMRGGAASADSVVPVPRDAPLPLSFSQERLWFLDRLEPDNAFYNIPAALRLRGVLHADALERALGELLRRHEALRTTFPAAGESAVQVVAPFAGFVLPVEDLSGADGAEREALARRRAGEEAARPFDLAAGPLFRARLLRLADDEHVLLLSMHHVVSDAWSVGVLVRELSALYGAFRDGRGSPLPEPALHYGDYAAWERARLRGPLLDARLAWWRERLAGAPALLELPTDHPRPAAQSYRGAYEPVELPGALADRLRALGRREGATLFMVLLGGFQVLLSRYAGSPDVVAGTTVAGRTRREVEGIVGLFMNTLALRTDLSGDPSFREVLRRVRETTLEAHDHQEVPFDRLVAELQPERTLSHSPLVQVLFELLDGNGPSGGLPGLRTEVLETELHTAKFDLALTLVEQGGAVRGTLGYRTDLWEPPTVRRMLGHLLRVLEQAADDVDRPVSRLDLLDADERARVVSAWNRTEAAYPADLCIHQRFEQQARRTPDAVAVAFGLERMTFAELDGAANRLAHHLRRRGVGPEVRVGLCLERGLEMMPAILGVMKAGGAYVPVDPSHPAERIGYVFADSGVSAVLTQARLADRLPILDGVPVPVLALDAMDAELLAERADAAPETGVTSENLCYVIYTSGSTGRPKGVAMHHRGVVNYIEWGIGFYGADAGRGAPVFSSMAVDLTITNLLPLFAGHPVRLLPEENPVESLAAVLRTAPDFGLIKITPVHLSLLTPMLTAEEARSAARTLVIGADFLPAEPTVWWQENAPGVRLMNEYGPTETVVGCSAYVLPNGVHRTGAVPVGGPIQNLTFYVLDAHGEPVPAGLPGELYIGGAGVARGYLDRPALSAEKFVPDPFAGGGARMYRTGDRARWLEGGNLMILGRTDNQVKIRGYRVELGEIEAVLRRQDGVRGALVVVREDVPGDRRLVAYVAGEAETDALRAALRGSLPEYMVPGAFVRLESLPKTATGKIDPKTLPAPDYGADAEAWVAPRTPVEQALADIWAELLPVDRVGVDDGFFDLGGHSLLALRAASRVRQALGVELPLRALFEAPTVRAMAALVEALRRDGAPVLPPIVPVERTDALPLSFAQERLWFLDRLQPDSPFYNVHAALRLSGALDARTVERAIGEIVRRHETLRTVFREADDAPVQVIAPFAGFSVPVEDLSALDGAEREDALRRRAAEEAARPFDLEAGPLFRATLLRLADEEHVLLVVMHHVVSDAWSSGILFREMVALYAAFRDGRPSPLPELHVQYADFAVWQREQLRGEALERQLAWWRGRLGDAPALLELPTDRPRRAVQSLRGARQAVEVPPALLERLNAVARGDEATLFMVLLGAFQVLLGRYAGTADVVVGTPVAGRDRGETEGLIGFFVNTVVLRTGLEGDPSFREVVRRVRETTLGAFQHQDVPFEKLVEELQPERSMSHAPLFQVAFALRNAEPPMEGVAGLEVTGVDAETETTKFDLTLELAESEAGLRGALVYSTDLWDAATLRRMALHLERVLEQVAADPNARLSALRLADEDERRMLVHDWNRTDRPYPTDVCLHERFQAHAAARPDAIALEWDDVALTYAQLDARTNQLAHHLRGLGVRPETRVGVLMERGMDLVVSVLAILKAGGAYVPLDPAYPAERLRLMVADAAIPVVLTHAAFAPSLIDSGAAIVALDEAADVLASQPTDAPISGATPENLAYIVYTSGSTGRPKGVMVNHRTVVQLVVETDYVRFGPGDRIAQASNASFDALAFEAWGAFLNGATLVGIGRDVLLSAPAMRAFLREKRITTLYQTTALLNQLSGEHPDIFQPLREVLFGGQAADADAVRRVIRDGKPRRLLHMYGPTETTAWCSYEDLHAVPDDALTVSVGRPTGNQRIYLLDAALQPTPVGIPGEAYVGGGGVVRGYLDRPGLTAERFVPDPFSTEPGARMYRTGDRLRWKADGTLEFVGRLDAQVKIRGFRIEPGEIEAALGAQADVREARVVVREDVPGEKRLVAYVVPAAEGGAVGEALRAHLRREMPEYMVPAAVIVLDRLPLTANGKLDVRALPAPELGGGEARYVAPRTPVEAALAEIWAELLGVERVGAEDGFFDLGGHSLLATRLVSRIRAAFGVELPLRALFEGPTVARVAERVEALRGGPAVLPPVVPVERAGALPLSFAQERLWYVDQLEPGSPLFNVPAVLRLSGALDGPALERALAEVVRRHEVLRTTFAVVDGAPAQVVNPAAPVPLPLEDLSALPPADREHEAGRRAAEEAATPFSLARGPLLRARLLRLAADEHVLLLTLHHAVTDGWSMMLLQRELSTLYAAFAAGRPSPLPEPALQYADFAHWQRTRLAPALDAQQAYWTARMAGALAVLDLPSDYPRPPALSHRGDRVPVALPADLAARLRAHAAAEGATLFMVLLAAWKVLLWRWSGQTDLVVGTSVAGRTRPELEGMAGVFINTLALRTELGGGPSFAEAVRRVRETTLGAFDHADLPFERLVEVLQPERTLGHTPVFQVLFELDNLPPATREDGLSIRAQAPELRTAKYDLSLSLIDGPEGIGGALEFSTDLFDPATARRMAAAYARLLHAAAEDPARPAEALPLLDADERRAVLHEWNRTEAPYSADLCIHQLFEAQARRTPDAVAVTFGAESLTYAALDARSNQLAHHLRGLGVGPEVKVGLCLERGLEMMACILGVMKAGGAYVPVDPSHPVERIGYVFDDSAVSVVLTQARLADRLPSRDGVPVLAVDAMESDLATEHGDGAPETGVTSENLCYVIYTSGSTGRPKGVAMHHRGVVNYIEWGIGHYGADEGSGSPVFSSMAVDLTITNLLALFAGKPVHFLPEENAVEALAAALRARPGYGALKITPVHLSLLTPLLTGDEARAAAHTLVVGADLLPAEPTVWWQENAPAVRLMNEYGPTETVVGCSAYLLPSGVHRHGVVPVGGPIQNLAFYVLDARMEPLPSGVPGELYIGGAGVARGYLGRPGLSAEKFVPDPFAGPGARMYRTGDRARWLDGGSLTILGRTDNQVKVRGYRVELGEIEAVLRRQAGVAGALVVLREDAPGDRRLVAYVAGGAETEALRAALRDTLPEYMVPSAFVRMDTLPQTVTGKIDPKTLPAPEYAAEQDAYTAPRTPVEEVLAGMWEELLRVERVGVHDDFFALGGHSLLATRIASRVREVFGVELPLRALFEDPTVAGCAAWVEARRGGAHAALPPIEHVAEPGVWLPLSFAQQRLWLVHQMEGDAGVYHQSVGFRLRGVLDVPALERTFTEIVRRHAVFRTRFVERDGVPGQVIDPPVPVHLPVVELSGEWDPAAALGERVRLQEHAPFDLEHGALLRVLLARTGADEHALVATMHHITSDGWSAGILFREVGALYAAFAEGRPSPLAEPALQYADYAVWQRAWLTPEREREQLDYWRGQLRGVPRLRLAGDRSQRPEGAAGAAHDFALDAELSEGVRALSRGLDATPFMTLLAAFKTLLRWQGGGDDVVVGTDIANRNLRAETEGLIGFFVNQLVLRTGMDGDPSFSELVARVRGGTLAAYDHQDLPFDRVVEALQPPRAAGETPFFRVKFVLQNAPEAGGAALPGLTLEALGTERGAAQLDVLLAMHDDGERMTGWWEYRTGLFSPELIARWTRRLQTVLRMAAADPGITLDALGAALDADERREDDEARAALQERRKARFTRR
jgi:amino acid adenylation domain-containing protein